MRNRQIPTEERKTYNIQNQNAFMLINKIANLKPKVNTCFCEVVMKFM